jgi:hypothetical protein
LLINRVHQTGEGSQFSAYGNSRANHQVNLPPQLAFGHRVELEERLPISALVSVVFSGSPDGNVLISRNLASCSSIVGDFIGVLLLGQAVFDIRSGHRCNDGPKIGVRRRS